MSFDSFYFLLRPKSNREFYSICNNLTNDKHDEAIYILKKMPNYDIFAIQEYAKQNNPQGPEIWIQAEIQRREFLLKQTAIFISILALIISIVALFS